MIYYKCPFCLHSFRRSSAILAPDTDGIKVYHCPNDRMEDGQLVCGKRLPYNFFDGESKVITIAGGANVGKTYYVIALLVQLKRNRSLQRMGISGQLLGEEKAKKYFTSRVEQHERGEPLDASIMRRFVEKTALVIDLTIQSGGRSKHVYLSFFDTPGEAIDDENYMLRHFQCVYKADGLILLAEPMQIRHLRKSILREHPYTDKKQPMELHRVFYAIISLMLHAQRNRVHPEAIEAARLRRQRTDARREADQQNGDMPREEIVMAPDPEPEPSFSERPKSWKEILFGLQPNKKLKCPIAVTITKIDQIKHLLTNNIPYDDEDFDTMYVRGRKFNRSLMRSIANDLRDVMFDHQYGEIGVKNLLESDVSNYSFFGIKSGDVEPGSGIIESMNYPQGVLLPLIWLLLELKMYQDD